MTEKMQLLITSNDANNYGLTAKLQNVKKKIMKSNEKKKT